MFKSNLKVEVLNGTENRKLLEPFSYVTSIGVEITVPKGFISNYATIPKIFRNIIDQDSPIIREISIIHDYLYSPESNNLNYTRNQSDWILFMGMLESNAPIWKAILAYLAVRIGGKENWKS